MAPKAKKTTGKTMTKNAISARLANKFEIKKSVASKIIDTLSSWGVLRRRRHRLHHRLLRGASTTAFA